MQDAAVHVHSAAAKPRILRALPGVLSDARLASGADCATAEAAVRHHNLLCETFDEGSNAAAHHAAAVDVYLEHLESLAVPHASEHAKMAACRPLEQACLECGPRRFVASLGRWGAALGKLADGADRDGNPTPSARAALRALAAMTRRASAMMDVPGVRKEAATVAQKTAAAALRRIESRESSAVFSSDDAVDAVDGVAVCLESHPAALRPKTDAVEAALVKVVLESPHGTNSMILSRATRALARLPRTGAFAFESASKQARSALVPAGAAAPPPSGGGAEKMIKGASSPTLAVPRRLRSSRGCARRTRRASPTQSRRWRRGASWTTPRPPRTPCAPPRRASRRRWRRLSPPSRTRGETRATPRRRSRSHGCGGPVYCTR